MTLMLSRRPSGLSNHNNGDDDDGTDVATSSVSPRHPVAEGMTNLPRCCGSRHKNQKSPRVQVSRASNVYTRTAGTFRLGCLHCARASQSAYTRYDLEWNRAKAHEVASLTMPSHVPAFHRRRMCTSGNRGQCLRRIKTFFASLAVAASGSVPTSVSCCPPAKGYVENDDPESGTGFRRSANVHL
ncbi:hypothetical protein HZH66_008372 [Vespula vulgaris]|uniref:Uncharacterized protein n=1 Tax=Vespula vulgaris TaxID=7454 RepID=A0A834N2F1_VESVU|nr:hypothetical protein HZH66_008372 [Vespula vulgaris]